MTQLRFSAPAILLLLITGCSFSLAEDVTPPPGYQAPELPVAAPTVVPAALSPAAAPPDPAAGAVIYTESCAPCHGETGLGDGFQANRLPNPAPAIGDPELARLSIPMDWYSVITQGRMDRFMPPFGGSLSDQQRWDVLAYVYSLSTSGETLSAGSSLYVNSCAGCHGSQGKGDGPEASSLDGPIPDLTEAGFFAANSSASIYQGISEGVGSSMPAFDAEFSEAERWALADYVRSLAFAGPDVEIAAAPTDQSGAESNGNVADPAADPAANPAEDGAPEIEELSQRAGRVTGVVRNGSGGEIPVGTPVTLHGFEHIEEVFSTTTEIGEDGSYVFEGVEMPDSRVFMVTIDFGGATYNSDIAIVEPDTDVINLPVTVYDTTDDASILVVERLHIFLEALEQGRLHIVELYLISNPSDKVIVATDGDPGVVHYKLPEGASGLKFQAGAPEDRFIVTEEGFADTMAIPPGSGQNQVMFAYDIPYGREAELKQSLTLPVNSIVLLVPDIGLKVKGERFEDNGISQFQGESYRVYTSDRYEAGSDLTFKVSGAPRSGLTSLAGQEQRNRVLASGIFLGLSLLVVGTWVVRRFVLLPRRETGPTKTSPASPLSPATAESEFSDVDSVLDAIIALDDLYRAGELPEEAYYSRRRKLFEVLNRMSG